jgi:hypothetical protein
VSCRGGEEIACIYEDSFLLKFCLKFVTINGTFPSSNHVTNSAERLTTLLEKEINLLVREGLEV